MPRPLNLIIGEGAVKNQRMGGLGDNTLPPCSSINVPAGFVGPINCDPSSGDVNYPASQSQLANLAQQLQAQTCTQSIVAGLCDWYLYAGGIVGFIFLLMTMKKR